MSDLPEISLLQQQHARPIPGAQLEMLGKRAAARWADGGNGSLTSAVTCVVKSSSAPLSPEQVRRVVEFANTEAYLAEFKKEGEHKIVDFGSEGPANPADVLRDLNDGGGATVMDSGLGDYRRPPEKTASSDEADAILQEAFMSKNASVGYPEANPYEEVIDLRDKLASACSHVASQISGLEVAYMDLSERLYNQVKQASLGGTALGEVIQAWSSVNADPDFVKAAFDQFVPRLVDDGVFHTLGEMGDSITKTAGSKYVNPNHPLVEGYNDFCQTLQKLAELRAQHDELFDSYSEANKFITSIMRKEAGGLLPTLHKAERVVTRGAKNVLGTGDSASSAIGHGVAYGIPAVAALGAGKYLGDLAVDSGVAAHVPGTQYYDYMRAQRQGGGY